MSQLLPYETIVKASEGDPEAVAAVLSHYKLLYPHWSGNGIAYAMGDRRQYYGALYKCLQAHTSQPGWTPTAAPSLWVKVLIPDPGTIPEWEQPESTNSYMAGDKVTHNGKTWVSDIDNNVWEPGVYGWTEASNVSA